MGRLLKIPSEGATPTSNGIGVPQLIGRKTMSSIHVVCGRRNVIEERT